MKVHNLCVIFAVVSCIVDAGSVVRPKSLTVNCQSNSANFKKRLMYRENAEDQTTIWLFKGEQLTINFELATEATIEILDVRYSNDGDFDEIGISLDDEKLGVFTARGMHAWGHMWNEFMSSGPIGGPQQLGSGMHSVTIKIQDADVYGVEIDYIRLDVHGGVLQQNGKNQFMCVHKPGEEHPKKLNDD